MHVLIKVSDQYHQKWNCIISSYSMFQFFCLRFIVTPFTNIFLFIVLVNESFSIRRILIFFLLSFSLNFDMISNVRLVKLFDY